MSLKERVDEHDREIAAIRKLIQTGMKMIVRIEELQAETRQDLLDTRKDLRILAAAQKRTEESLNAFIRSMTKGGNGHVKQKIE